MTESLKRIVRENRLLSTLLRVLRTRQVALLDYRTQPQPRYGHGKPPHAALHTMLSRRREEYRNTLRQFLTLREPLSRIAARAPENSSEPRWLNGYLPALDAVALYGFLTQRRPRRFLEIGSGNSTAFARRAIRDNGLPTSITSIDPHPRREIDAICDFVLREPLESVELSAFDALDAGDIVFMDGSHRSLMNSDATVFFLEVLPRLRPGVLVQIHDILLPADYPPEWRPRFYSEQYLLACWLLAETPRFDVVLPNAYISQDPDLHAILDPIWTCAALRGVPKHGVSFWLQKK